MNLHAAKAMPEWLDVSRETFAFLDQFFDLVVKWNPAINLVSRRSVPDLWDRHILDSAQIFSFIPGNARTLVDLGSGGGFPGIILAILAKECLPHLHVTLVEADQRKAAFLLQAVRQLSLRCSVVAQRIEALSPQSADVVTARALAPMQTLCGHVARHLHPAGLALVPKGAGTENEIAEALRIWSFSVTRTPSKSDDSGMILAITDLRHV